MQPLIAGVDLSGRVRSSVDGAGELNHTLERVDLQNLPHAHLMTLLKNAKDLHDDLK